MRLRRPRHPELASTSEDRVIIGGRIASPFASPKMSEVHEILELVSEQREGSKEVVLGVFARCTGRLCVKFGRSPSGRPSQGTGIRRWRARRSWTTSKPR